MGLEELKQEIIGSANKSADAIISEAKSEADKTLNQIEQKIDLFRKKLNEDRKSAASAMEKTIRAMADSECRKAMLEKKKEIMESVFEAAKAALSGLGSEKREQHIASLLKTAKSEIEAAKFFCSSKDAKYLNGLKCENADILGGLIAENKDGTIRVDYSYETLLSDVKEHSMQEVAKILFG
ncbi:MAG: V-type ATP synthase subunit E family protein [Candidatus Woesearchaeota archaeon]|nr:V-type ATP synthase subunit E family protein [Candidatus Woesearchaeota archaeon]